MSFNIVYWSGPTKNTKRLVDKLNMNSQEIKEGIIEPSVLFMPSYGVAGVPKDVNRALSDPDQRNNVVAVVGTGNLNFGRAFCGAAIRVANKLNVPLLARVEVFGTNEDVQYIKEKMEEMWTNSTLMI